MDNHTLLLIIAGCSALGVVLLAVLVYDLEWGLMSNTADQLIAVQHRLDELIAQGQRTEASRKYGVD